MQFSYHNKTFKPLHNSENGEVSEEVRFLYQQEGNILTCSYKGGTIVTGHLMGLVANNGIITMHYHQVNNKEELMTGTCISTPEMLPNGKIRLHENWQWTSGDKSSGTSLLEQI